MEINTILGKNRKKNLASWIPTFIPLPFNLKKSCNSLPPKEEGGGGFLKLYTIQVYLYLKGISSVSSSS